MRTGSDLVKALERRLVRGGQELRVLLLPLEQVLGRFVIIHYLVSFDLDRPL
jgi:hypothetical protein